MVNLDLQEQLQNALANIRLPHDSPEHEVVTEQKLVNRLKLVLSACFHNSNIARKSRKVHCRTNRCIIKEQWYAVQQGQLSSSPQAQGTGAAHVYVHATAAQPPVRVLPNTVTLAASKAA